MSSGHQVTIPRHPYGEAGLDVGDRFDVTADGPGRVILERIDPAADTLALNGPDPSP
jgi:bifunctional DNA-binding transcriptional regulator/antitoxin component of YhaV-PrlF toxin-antitoxin module